MRLERSEHVRRLVRLHDMEHNQHVWRNTVCHLVSATSVSLAWSSMHLANSAGPFLASCFFSTPSGSLDDSQTQAGSMLPLLFAGCTRLYPEKERVPVTWADACLTASFFALQKILRFSLFAAAVFLPFDTYARLSELLGLRRSMPSSSCHGTRTRFKHGHNRYLVSSETVRRKTGHQDGTVAVRVTASGLCWLASLARALYRESANDLSDQLISLAE